MKVSKIKLNFLTTFLILFPTITSLGLYGYGRDFTNAYYGNPIAWDQIKAPGWNIAGTMIGSLALGPFLVAFILPLSIYLLIKQHLNIKENLNRTIVNTSFVFLIHNWATILPILNALRQGLATGPFYLIILSLDKLNKRKKNLEIIFLIILSLTLNFLHKLGTLFFIVLSLSYIILKIKESQRRLSLLISSFLISFFLIEYYGIGNVSTRVIGLDLRLPFFIFASLYCSFILFFRKKEFISKFIFIVPFYMNIFSIAFLILGYNFEFERLQMAVFIPQYIAFISILKNKYKYLILLFSSLIFFLITIYAGIFDSFVSL